MGHVVCGCMAIRGEKGGGECDINNEQRRSRADKSAIERRVNELKAKVAEAVL